MPESPHRSHSTSPANAKLQQKLSGPFLETATRNGRSSHWWQGSIGILPKKIGGRQRFAKIGVFTRQPGLDEGLDSGSAFAGEQANQEIKPMMPGKDDVEGRVANMGLTELALAVAGAERLAG